MQATADILGEIHSSRAAEAENVVRAGRDRLKRRFYTQNMLRRDYRDMSQRKYLSWGAPFSKQPFYAPDCPMSSNVAGTSFYFPEAFLASLLTSQFSVDPSFCNDNQGWLDDPNYPQQAAQSKPHDRIIEITQGVVEAVTNTPSICQYSVVEFVFKFDSNGTTQTNVRLEEKR